MFRPCEPDKKAVLILDFDGTVADDEYIVVDTFNEFAEDYGINPVSKVSEIKKKVYCHPLTCFRLFTVRDELQTEILDALAAKIDRVVIDVELANLLKELHEKKVPLGILTTNRDSTVRKFLISNSINPDMFMFIESAVDKRKRLKQLLEIYNIDGTSSYYMGDQTTDIQAARNLTGTIAVTWGYDSKSDLKKMDPTESADNIQEVRKILQANKKIKFDNCCNFFRSLCSN